MTKLDRGVNGFVGAVSDIAFNFFPGIVYPAISLVIMLSPDARLSLIVLFFAPLPALIGMWAAGEQTRRERALILASMELRPAPKRSFRRAAQNPWVF